MLSLAFSPTISTTRDAVSPTCFGQFGHAHQPKGSKRVSMRIVAAERRDSLNHLQKADSKQPSQSKQRVAQVAPVGIWDRFPTARTVQQMLDTMERIMEDPFTYPSVGEEGAGSGGGYRRARTPWEIREGDGEYKMRFDMPGMTKRDVKVWVEENMLVVKAEKEADQEEDWSAKSYGRYSSRIALPENIELEKIKAEVKDGVLYITIPKSKTVSKVLDVDVN